MAENNNRTQAEKDNNQKEQSIGNQQGTTQTGAQNNGGKNITEHNDQYTEDLRQSGDRQADGQREER